MINLTKPFPVGAQGAFPTATGAATYGGSATAQDQTGFYGERFIPSIWSGKILEKFYDTTILSAISNTDYEGEIKNQGDHVIIRTRPTITVSDYSADQILTPERPSSDVVELMIDKGIYWNTVLDDVMDVQADLNMMSMWAQDAAEQMKIKIDRGELDLLYNQCDPANKGTAAGRVSQNINLGATTTPVDLTAGASVGVTGLDAITKVMVGLGQALDEQNVPESGRFVVCSPAVCTYMKLSELRQVQISGDGTSMVRNGMVGTWDRMTVYVSNLLPTATTSAAGGDTTLAADEQVILAGHDIGLTFASQLTKVETLRAETTFGTLMRGLNVYGSKVVQPIAVAGAVVKV